MSRSISWTKVSLDKFVKLASLIFLLIAGLHLFNLLRFASDVPFGDEWEYLTSKENLSTFSIEWLVKQHNEHRIIPTKIQTWLLYQINNWDIRFQIIQNFFIYLVLVAIIVFSLKSCKPRDAALVIFGSIFLLSTGSAENHAWGFQSQFHFVMLFSVLACVFLFKLRLTLSRVLIASVMSLAAVYSFSSGIAMVASISLLFIAYVAFRYFISVRSGRELAWLFVYLSLVGLGFYFYFTYNFHKVVGHPNYAFPHEPIFWQYFLHLFARGFGVQGDSLWPGIGFLIICTVPMLFLGWRQLRQPRRVDRIFWFLLSLYGIVLASLVTITIGRAGFGYLQARSSRYVEFTAVLIPITICAYVCLLDMKKRAGQTLLISLFLLLIYSHRKSWDFHSTYHQITQQRVKGLACLKEASERRSSFFCEDLYPADLTSRLEVARQLEVSFYQKMQVKLPDNESNLIISGSVE